MADTLDTAAGVAAVLGGDAPDPALPLRQSLNGALDANPDQEAKLQAAARTVGVSPLAARYAPDIVRRQARMQALDIDRLAHDFPSTTKLLIDQDKARVAHDDVGTLQAVETAISQAARWVVSADREGGLARELVGAVRSVASGVPAASSGIYGALAVPFGLADQGLQALDDLAATLTGTPRRQIVGTPGPESFLLDIARGQKRLANDVQGMPEDAGWWRRAIGSGLQSAGQSLLGLGLGVASPAAMLGFMGATQGGQSYSQAREAGASPLHGLAYGLEDAAAEIVTEKFMGAGGLLERMMAGQSAGKLFAFELFKEVPGEMAATLWQNFNEWANLHPEKSLRDWLDEQPDALAQTVLATLVGGGVQIGAVKALQHATGQAARQADAAHQAEQTAQALQAMATLAEASKLRERDPATFAAFAQDLADQGLPAVHIEARALADSGVNLPELVQAMPSVGAQIEQALQTGGDVVIPTGELLAAGAQFAEPLVDHLRTAPDAMSKAEADAYLKEHGEALQAEVERVLGQQQTDEAATVSRDAVRDRYAAELQAAGRTADAAKAEATLLASFFDRMGQRLGGLTAEQVAERYQLRVQRQGAGGDVVMDQPDNSRQNAAVANPADVAGNDSGRPAGDNTEGVTFRRVRYRGESVEAIASGDDLARIEYEKNDGFILRAADGQQWAEFSASGDFIRAGSDWITQPNPEQLASLSRLAKAVAQQIQRNKAAAPEGIYIRFGKPPKSGRSRNHVTGQMEAGVSVFPAKADRLRGLVKVQESEGMVQDAFLNAMLNGQQAYAVTGEEVGKGSDGEPLLENVRIVGKLNYQDEGAGFKYQPNESSAPAGSGADASRSNDQKQTPEFRRWFGDSKVVDAEGKPLVVYHGTREDFSVFDYSRIGQQGRAEGAGFYFTTSEKVAAGYGKPVRVYLSIKKPLPYKAAGFSKAVVQKIIKRVAELEAAAEGTDIADGFLSNFGDVRTEGLAPVVREAAAMVAADETALDQLSGIVGSGVNPQFVNEATREVTGYDGVVADGFSDVGDAENRIFVAFFPEQIKSATNNRGTFDPNSPNIFEQAAYHGTPHRGIEKFSTDKIGTGEGAQAFGWGLYFTDRREIAEWYRNSLTAPKINGVKMNGRKVNPGTPIYHAVRKVVEAGGQGTREEVIAHLRERVQAYRSLPNPFQRQTANILGLQEVEGALKKVEAAKSFAVDMPDRDPGQLYEVEIPDDEHMLLWDKPLSEQPDVVQSSARTLKGDIDRAWLDDELDRRNAEWEELTGQDLYLLVQKALVDDALVPNFKSESEQAQLDGRTDKAASLLLADDGIKGIKYLDGTSRSTGDGSFNYVVFSGDDVAIKAQFYQQARGQIAFGQDITQQPSVIALLKDADLSTFIHELGHFFLQVQVDVAARIVAQQRQGVAAQAGEQGIVDDVRTALAWMGVQDTPEISAIDHWLTLTPDQQREMHEKFARGFERFAFEGKAPSIELQGVFQRFRAWLVGVYKQLVNLRVDLTDEVRGVMSRMLASEEQIRITEQARSLLPLFTSADQAGMTQQEWADYQDLGQQATADAIDTLQARSLRDMQWLRNARSRVLRRLQREAAAQRREVRAQVRIEVMGQPVYQAWAFLTGKLEAEDRLGSRGTKSSGRELDPTRDSLLVAIAKMGGINRESARRDLGVHPDDAKVKAPVFGASAVFRLEGGRSADDMLQALTETGYMRRLDEFGRSDLHELEDLIAAELHGEPQFSAAHDYAADDQAGGPVNPEALRAGRLDLIDLKNMGLPAETIDRLVNLKMTAKNGLHPDVVADLFRLDSGDRLLRELADAPTPSQAIESLTDQRMLERYGDLATPAAIERAADAAVANEARGRMIAAEAAALERAIGPRQKVGQAGGRSITRSVMPRVAREWAQSMIARLKVRDLRPARYTAAEARAARNAAKASAAGDLTTAAAEKRNELVQHYAAKQAHEALDEIERGLRYLRKFDNEGTRKALDAEYLDQIDALLERFDLRQASLKAIDKRTALMRWVESQREQGFEPSIPESLLNEARRQNYRDMSVEEFRGLVDGVRQIEHLARLKHKLLTARDQREYEAIRDEIAGTIDATAGDRVAHARTAATKLGRVADGFRRFWAAHIKVATWVHVFDGGREGGPLWEHMIRPANEAADRETTMRAAATQRLSEILAPVFKLGKMGGAGAYFPSIDRSLNREQRIAIALNTGNSGNLQRLLDGEGWTMQQLQPVLQSLTAAEWRAVQEVWDHLESYRPEIAAKERRVYGKEPNWVEPMPFAVRAADGPVVNLRGGYYPVKYDPAASQRAEEHADAEAARREMQGAYTSATTRRSFTKDRADEVKGRPLLYTLAGLYTGVNDVIHDLTHHEFLIDANRLLRSTEIDQAIRRHYGPEVKAQFKSWIKDVAEGGRGTDSAIESAIGRLRQGISAAGLGFNVMSAAIQPLGFSQSISLLGVKWAGRGLARYVANPRALAREVTGRSEFMANRARTRFRELAELRNRVEDQGKLAEWNGRWGYWLMMQAQATVDLPTWWGAYEKALAAGEVDERAVGLADQAVIDSQGGGHIKDLAAVERGGPAAKLFTVFYSFMNTTLNLAVRKTMTADTPAKKAKLAADMLLILVVPGVLTGLLKDALTPGDAGDDDWDALARKLIAAQLDQIMGLFVLVRELSEVSKIVTGAEGARSYSGPAGVRLLSDALRAAQQAKQGEFDDAFRKAMVNLAGDATGLPAAQINRTVTGAQALQDGKTDNPAALVFGYQEPR